MGNHVYWLLDLKIKEGELENFRTLMKEMVEATKANEPGTLNYEWTISSDNTSIHLYERYADSAATMKHLGSFMKNFAGRFMACVEPKSFVVYGQPSEEVKGALRQMGAVFMNPFGGFAR